MKGVVLITGVAGFLGRHVARHFVQEGWRVVGLDEVPVENANLPSVSYHRIQLPGTALGELLRTSAPGVCVHCAGRASVGLSMDDPGGDFHGNAALTFELLDALRRHAPDCRFVLLSSAAVYGNPATLPVGETALIAPLSPYGYHKRQAELLCEEFSRIYALPTMVARIFSAYGPGLRRQVVWDMCEKVLTFGELELRGTGQESRDFIHADDIARGLMVLAERARGEGEIYNLASGQEVTIATLARTVLETLGSKVQPHFDGMATPGNPLNWCADIAKIAALGFVPTIPLKQGIEGMARWAEVEMANCRSVSHE